MTCSCLLTTCLSLLAASKVAHACTCVTCSGLLTTCLSLLAASKVAHVDV